MTPPLDLSWPFSVTPSLSPPLVVHLALVSDRIKASHLTTPRGTVDINAPCKCAKMCHITHLHMVVLLRVACSSLWWVSK